MSIPLYFEANFIDDEGRLFKNPYDKKGLDIVVDGGIIGNFPIAIFDEYAMDSTGEEYRVYNPRTLAACRRGAQWSANGKYYSALRCSSVT